MIFAYILYALFLIAMGLCSLIILAIFLSMSEDLNPPASRERNPFSKPVAEPLQNEFLTNSRRWAL